MKLAALYLDRMVVIPDAGRPGCPRDVREQTYLATDGWQIEFIADASGGVFVLRREGMPHAVHVHNVGATYVLAPTMIDRTPTPEPGPPAQSDARVQVPQASPPNNNQRRKQR